MTTKLEAAKAAHREAKAAALRQPDTAAEDACMASGEGEADTLAVLLDNLVIAQMLSKELRQSATEEARAYLYDRRHRTPADPRPDALEALRVAREAIDGLLLHGAMDEGCVHTVAHRLARAEARQALDKIDAVMPAPTPEKPA